MKYKYLSGEYVIVKLHMERFIENGATCLLNYVGKTAEFVKTACTEWREKTSFVGKKTVMIFSLNEQYGAACLISKNVDLGKSSSMLSKHQV